MSKLSHKVRHDLRLSVSDRMELADALDAMESALRAVIAAPVTLAVPTDDECPWRHQIIARAALLKLEGK